VRHADQYAKAAWDSIRRIVEMLSAVGISAMNLAMVSAILESSNLCRATCSCPLIFCRISSRAIRKAAPEECDKAWARRRRASDGRTGPVVANTDPSRSSMRKLAFWAANQRRAESETNPSEPITTKR
jgi:hypothetical protein